jgi:hypothetical protein
LPTAWYDPALSAALLKDETLFTMKFDIINPIDSGTVLSIKDAPIRKMAIGEAFRPLSFTSEKLVINVVDPLAGLRIYPNPSARSVNVEMFAEETENVEVFVYDLQGRLVFTKTRKASLSETLDFGALRQGMYIMKVKAGENIYAERFVLQ